MLAAKAVLPPLLLVVRPKAEQGAVEGLGVPLMSGSTKDDLGKPMERGIYAISTPDQKTVLKMRVFSKEEAGFDPTGVLGSSIAASLSPEIRGRIGATWTILQLTFESYDPKLYPALDFMLLVASRLAFLTDGVVADPLAAQYRMPETLPSPRDDSEPFTIYDFVTVQGDGTTFRTAGLAKFSHREICLSLVPADSTAIAVNVLLSVAAGVLKGKTLAPGDHVIAHGEWIVGEMADVGPAWGESKPLELLPVRGSVEDQFSKAGTL